MRVLFVSQEMPPETGWGGIGTYVDVLSEALAAKGIDVHVLSVVEGQPASRKQIAGVTIHRHPLPQLRGAGRLPPETWRRIWLSATVARLVKRLPSRPTVVECPEWSAEGLALALRGALPLVVRLHSSARQLFGYTGQGKHWRGLDGRLAAMLEEASARRAHVVVSTASNLAEVSARLRLDERAVHAISYPLRLPPLSPMPDWRAPLQVTFLGRFEPRKAPEVLLGAVPRVLSAVPGAHFVFVGRDATGSGAPGSAAWLRSEAERIGVAHAVEVREEFGRAVVDRELRRSAVCAVPSRWESFGYVVAEAASVGRPVVVSSIPPFQELVEDGISGRVVPGEDADAWAVALVDVLSSPDRAQAMGRAGAAKIATISDPGRVADLALESYRHAVELWRSKQRVADD